MCDVAVQIDVLRKGRRERWSNCSPLGQLPEENPMIHNCDLVLTSCGLGLVESTNALKGNRTYQCTNYSDRMNTLAVQIIRIVYGLSTENHSLYLLKSMVKFRVFFGWISLDLSRTINDLKFFFKSRLILLVPAIFMLQLDLVEVEKYLCSFLVMYVRFKKWKRKGRKGKGEKEEEEEKEKRCSRATRGRPVGVT
jgi:hypothetical protein